MLVGILQITGGERASRPQLLVAGLHIAAITADGEAHQHQRVHCPAVALDPTPPDGFQFLITAYNLLGARPVRLPLLFGLAPIWNVPTTIPHGPIVADGLIPAHAQHRWGTQQPWPDVDGRHVRYCRDVRYC